MFFSCHCYAMIQLYGGGTLVEHFEEHDVPLPENIKNMQAGSTLQASTSAIANYVSGVHETNIKATGNVSFQIVNNWLYPK